METTEGFVRWSASHWGAIIATALVTLCIIGGALKKPLELRQKTCRVLAVMVALIYLADSSYILLTQHHGSWEQNLPFHYCSMMLLVAVFALWSRNRTACWVLYFGALTACMQGLKARGIKIALATSTQRPVVECYLQNTPELRDVFDATVCGIEVPNGKPAPDIYQEAARRVGLTPEECVGIEDSRNGLRSLRAAGVHSVMIPDLLPFSVELTPYVDTCLDSLSDLCPLIDRLNWW